MDTKLKKSTGFHLQTDGQTEVVSRTTIHLLRGYCSKHPKLWDEQLHYIQHAYNSAKQSSTLTSPFEACLGYFPKSPLDFIFEKYVVVDGHSDIERENKSIEQIQLIHQTIQEQLEKSQGKYKARHDKHRVDHQFHLDLSSYMQIYSIVNVENLRLYEPPLTEDQGENAQIPSIEDFSPEFLDVLQQDAILDKRTRTTKRGSIDYLRVGLKDTHPSKAKWIEVGKVREQCPHLFNN
eukprot:PITA_21915